MSPRSRATIKSASTMRTHRLRDIPAAMDSEAAVACFFLGGPVGGSDSLSSAVLSAPLPVIPGFIFRIACVMHCMRACSTSNAFRGPMWQGVHGVDVAVGDGNDPPSSAEAGSRKLSWQDPFSYSRTERSFFRPFSYSRTERSFFQPFSYSRTEWFAPPPVPQPLPYRLNP